MDRPPFRRSSTSTYDPANPEGNIPYIEAATEEDQRQEARYVEERRRALETRDRDRDLDDILHHVQPKDVGKFKVPKAERNFYRVHRRFVNRFDLDFNTQEYPSFDGIIATAFQENAFSNPKHRDYQKYDGLRQNVAILRNIIFSQYFPDGKCDSSDPEDVARCEQLPRIAREIGVALQRDSSLRLPFSTYMPVAVANTPDYGAMEMYKMLLKLQNERTLFHPLAWAFGLPNFDWKLPTVDKTAFATFEQDMTRGTITTDKASHMVQIDFEIDKMITGNTSVEALSAEDKATSIAEAKKILENLKLLMGQEQRDPGLLLNSAHQDEVIVNTGQLIQAYLLMKSASGDTGQDTALMHADAALGKLAYLLKIRTADVLKSENRLDEANEIYAVAQKMPAEWQNAKNTDFNALVETLALGMYSAEQLQKLKTQGRQLADNPAQQLARQTVSNTGKAMSGADTRISAVNNPALAEQLKNAQPQQQQVQQEVAVPQMKI